MIGLDISQTVLCSPLSHTFVIAVCPRTACCLFNIFVISIHHISSPLAVLVKNSLFRKSLCLHPSCFSACSYSRRSQERLRGAHRPIIHARCGFLPA